MSLLPLFPLGTVLMPGARLPLRVFEARYLALLRDLIADPENIDPFGVVAIRAGYEVGEGQARDLYEVGCTAEIDELTPVGDSEFALVATGGRRFRLVEIDPYAGTPYPLGQVTWLPEAPGDPVRAAATADEVRRILPEYWEALGAAGMDADGLARDPLTLSYQVDRLMVLDTPDRQLLLAADTAEDRLDTALRLLRRERDLVGRLGTVPMRPERGLPNLN